MGNLVWRLKETVRGLVPWVIIGSIAWGGYSLYKKGAFRRGVPSLNQVLSYLPHFGSRFRQHGPRRTTYRYSPAKKSYTHKKARHRKQRLRRSRRYRR